MITQFRYSNSLSQFIKLKFNNIMQLGTNENILFHNLCQFCENDYETEFDYNDYKICYYNPNHNIKSIDKNEYLVNNLIVYCIDRNYVKYLDFIQQICKEHFYLNTENRLVLQIKFIPAPPVGRFRKIKNDNYIFISKQWKLDNKFGGKYNEFNKFHLLFHEYLHFLLSPYNLYGFFEEGFIELLINQNFKMKCHCRKWIKSAIKRGNGNTPEMYQLFKIWACNVLRDTKLINNSHE